MLEQELVAWRYHVCQFSGKTDNFDFLGPSLPKMDLGLEIQKTNIGVIISIVEMPCVTIFRKNGQL